MPTQETLQSNVIKLDVSFSEEESDKKIWTPTEEQKKRIKFVYDERKDMITKRDQPYVQFNDRTLKEFIDELMKLTPECYQGERFAIIDRSKILRKAKGIFGERLIE